VVPEVKQRFLDLARSSDGSERDEIDEISFTKIFASSVSTPLAALIYKAAGPMTSGNYCSMMDKAAAFSLCIR
jgi:hypothetical protein